MYNKYNERHKIVETMLTTEAFTKKGACDFFLKQLGEDQEVFATAVTEAIIHTHGSEYLKQEQNETLIQLSAQIRNELRNKFRDSNPEDVKKAFDFITINYPDVVEDNEIYKSLLDVARKGTHMALSNTIALKSLVTDLFPVLNALEVDVKTMFETNLKHDPQFNELFYKQRHKQNSNLVLYTVLYSFAFNFLRRFTFELTIAALDSLSQNIDNPKLAEVAKQSIDDNLIDMLQTKKTK